jgi:hypothetical protein
MLDWRTAGAAAGLDETASGWAVQDLVDEGFLRGVKDGSAAYRFMGYFDLRLTERGRRAVGQWPPGAIDALLAELDRHIARERDPEKKGRLQRWRDAAAEVAPEVVGSAIGAFTSTAMGL